MKNLKQTIISTAISAVIVSSSALAASNDSIQRNILTDDRGQMGTVTLHDLGVDGTKVSVKINRVATPGKHAMHFHEKGVCNAPDFKSAGGHYKTGDSEHGLLVDEGPHAGDMMNIEVNNDGVGMLTVINSRVSIHGDNGLPALFDDNGSALIIHAKADDYMSQPSGAAGERIGCAVIDEL